MENTQENKVIVDAPIPDTNGVKYEVALKIQEMLRKGKRHFGSAGASLSWELKKPDHVTSDGKKMKQGALRVGISGERDTSYEIRKWMEDKPNAVLVDSVHIRGMGTEVIDPETGIPEGGDTDHILVIGNQVILIDTKRWKSKRAYSISDKGAVLRQGRAFAAGRIRTKQAKYMWKKYLHTSAKISSIICINSEKTFVKMDANWKKQPYRLYTLEKMLENLTTRYEKFDDADREKINSTLIAQLVVSCIKPYDPYRNVFNADTLENFK